MFNQAVNNQFRSFSNKLVSLRLRCRWSVYYSVLGSPFICVRDLYKRIKSALNSDGSIHVVLKLFIYFFLSIEVMAIIVNKLCQYDWNPIKMYFSAFFINGSLKFLSSFWCIFPLSDPEISGDDNLPSNTQIFFFVIEVEDRPQCSLIKTVNEIVTL